MILLVFKEETELSDKIIKDLDDYFFNNGYSEKIKSLYSNNMSAVDTVVEITKIRPDVMIYITFSKEDENTLSKNILVSTCQNPSIDSLVLQENIIKYLKLNTDSLDSTYVFKNLNCTNYIIRLKPFPTILMKIDSRLENSTIFAKAIYKAMTSQYKIPKLNQERLHKCAANLNMRTSPDKNGEFIVKVPKETKCVVLERTNNVYWKIRVTLNNKSYIGYCTQTYIRLM